MTKYRTPIKLKLHDPNLDIGKFISDVRDWADENCKPENWNFIGTHVSESCASFSDDSKKNKYYFEIKYQYIPHNIEFKNEPDLLLFKLKFGY